jgi:hypothetical protein
MLKPKNTYYIENLKKNNNTKLIIIFIIIIIVLITINYLLYNYPKEQFTTGYKKYNLAIMTIFKNEQDYMEEWLNHHISQGFEQIYLYSNDPNIHLYTYLSNPKYNQYIKLIDWVDKKNIGSQTIQRQSYTHCVKNYSSECQFLLMLDLDEFIIPIKSYSKVSEYINSLKTEWNQIKAFKIQRYDFGSNGHLVKPSGNVMLNYTKHEKICSSYKTLANTDYINKQLDFYGVHDYNYNDDNKQGKIFNNYFGYHETGFPNSCKSNSLNEIPLVINHYYTKSYQEYLSRCELWKQGGINPIGYRTDCISKFKSRNKNEVKDY